MRIYAWIVLAIIFQFFYRKAFQLRFYLLNISSGFISLFIFFSFESWCMLYLWKWVLESLNWSRLNLSSIALQKARRILLSNIIREIKLSSIICHIIFIYYALHLFNYWTQFDIKILGIIRVLWRWVMDTTRISWIISISIPFARFRFSLSCFLLSNTTLSFKCLKNCFRCRKFDSKLSCSFFYCNFSWYDSLNEFLTHFLWDDWILLFLRIWIFLRILIISISSTRSLISITGHTLWV